MRMSSQYWSLKQAVAWVVFRDLVVVEKFSPPEPENWSAFMMYPTMRTEYPELGHLTELFDALKAGNLKAFGRQSPGGSKMQEIKAIEWNALVPEVSGPYLRREDGAKNIPWLDICISRSDVERHWRRSTEVEGRTLFNWDEIKCVYEEVREANPGFSKNKLIDETELALLEKHPNKRVPSRSSFQNHIKKWLANT